MPMPQRSPRITKDKQLEIVRLDLRRVNHSDIARIVRVHRNTVRRVIKRTAAAMAINHDLDKERSQALSVYREVQAAAWHNVAKAEARGHSPAELLAEVRLAQTRIDEILGLEPAHGLNVTMRHQVTAVDDMMRTPITLVPLQRQIEANNAG